MTHPPTQPPNDDQDLIRFLQQYRPQPPSASPNLEERILSVVEQLENAPQRRQQRWYRSPWVPTAIAAGLVVGLVSYRALLPSRPNPAELRSLEAFMETNWNASVNDDAEEDWSSLRSQELTTRLVATSSNPQHTVPDSQLPAYRR
jgi:hypothetical protein